VGFGDDVGGFCVGLCGFCVLFLCGFLKWVESAAWSVGSVRCAVTVSKRNIGQTYNI
jgi:hypothetical protein